MSSVPAGPALCLAVSRAEPQAENLLAPEFLRSAPRTWQRDKEILSRERNTFWITHESKKKSEWK